MVLIGLKELPCLGAKAIYVRADWHPTNFDLGPCPDLVLEIRIPDRALLEFDQLDETPQPAPSSARPSRSCRTCGDADYLAS